MVYSCIKEIDLANFSRGSLHRGAVFRLQISLGEEAMVDIFYTRCQLLHLNYEGVVYYFPLSLTGWERGVRFGHFPHGSKARILAMAVRMVRMSTTHTHSGLPPYPTVQVFIYPQKPLSLTHPSKSTELPLNSMAVSCNPHGTHLCKLFWR